MVKFFLTLVAKKHHQRLKQTKWVKVVIWALNLDCLDGKPENLPTDLWTLLKNSS